MGSKINKTYKIFCLVGTRPEYIKMYPVYNALKKHEEEFNLQIKWIQSSQHKELLEDLESYFKVPVYFSFDLSKLKDSNSLGFKAALILEKATELFSVEKPDLVIVQGDTLTAQQIALAAYYEQIPLVHIEAGLRTYDLNNPYPEELSRRIVSQVASLHFAPTQNSFESLKKELEFFQNPAPVVLCGNTGIDTLLAAANKPLAELPEEKLILVTAHRRENMQQVHQDLADALFDCALKHSQVKIFVATHKNPKAKEPFLKLERKAQAHNLENIEISEALGYAEFINLMSSAYFIITDSGGIQEEAPYLSKPVLVLREKTERIETINLGFAKYIGKGSEKMLASIEELLNNPEIYKSMLAKSFDAYGDGKAADKIAEHIIKQLLNKQLQPQSPLLCQ